MRDGKKIKTFHDEILLSFGENNEHRKILGYSKEQLNDSVLFWMREANKLCNTDIEETRNYANDFNRRQKMENNKVRQFTDLLLEGETVESAAKVSGIGDMKLVDVLKTISEMEFENIKAFSSAVAGMNSMKEAIQTVKDLNDVLVGLKKSSEK